MTSTYRARGTYDEKRPIIREDKITARMKHYMTLMTKKDSTLVKDKSHGADLSEKKTNSSDKMVSRKVKAVLKENLLIIMMIIAVIIGVSLGLGLRSVWDPSEKRKIFFLKFPGDLLMNMLKCLILPLIISSLISAIATLDSKASGRMGARAVIYYLTTTLIAVIIGIIMVLSIQPGTRGAGNITKSGKTKSSHPIDALMDLIRNCFPVNLVEACFQKQVTEVGEYVVKEERKVNVTCYNYTMVNSSKIHCYNAPIVNMTLGVLNDTMNVTSYDDMVMYPKEVVDSPKVTTGSGMNILGLVVFSIFFGAVISKMGPAGKPLGDFFEALHIASMKLVTLVIWYSPFGIIFLIASKLVDMEDPESMFTKLAYYMATVLSGLAIHAFIVLPLVYFIAVRKNPFKFMYYMLKALLTAWGTASSSSTLPITMECLEKNNGVDIRVVKFVAPIGATVNMDGTALYEAVAAIFIAQYTGLIELDVGSVIIISLTSTAAAIGAAGVPQAGLVTMAIVLTAVGLPVDEIRLILSIDWFLDRFRTAVNVLGDSYGAGIVAHLSRNDLPPIEHNAYQDDSEVDYHPEKIKKAHENEAFDKTDMSNSNGRYDNVEMSKM